MARDVQRVDFYARLIGLADRMGHHHRIVLVTAVLLTAVCISITVARLSFNTDLADLLPPDHPDLLALRRIQERYATDTGFMVLLSKNYVFALEASGAIRRHDGRAWRRWPSQGFRLHGLWGLSATEVYAVGDGGRVLRNRADSWEPLKTDTRQPLRGIWGERRDRLLAVGDGGTVLRFDGARWQAVASGTRAGLRAVSGRGEEAFAVGERGTILRYDGSRLTPERSGITADLLGVAAVGDGAVYAVGEGGTFLRREDGGWRAIRSPVRTALRAVFALAPGQVIAVGDGGVALHFDGKALRRRSTGTTEALRAIHGSGERDVWATGDECTVRRWQGEWEAGPHTSWEEHKRSLPTVLERVMGRTRATVCEARFVAVWRPRADMEPVKAFAPKLAALLERSPNISRVDYRKPVTFFKDRALLFAGVEDLQRLVENVEESLEQETAKASGLYVDLEEDRTTERREDFKEIAGGLNKTADELGIGTSEWFLHPDGTSLGVVVQPSKSGSDLENLRSLKQEIAAIIARSGHKQADPLLRIDITGDGVDKIREYDASVQDIFGLTPYAIAGIVLLILIYFRSLTGLIFVALPLGMSIAWTFAITTIFIGTLNLVTGFLFAVLFGLGIDFGLQLFARYREGRRAGLSMEAARKHMVLDTGRATVTSALTTSVALLTLTILDFRGFSEFGFIAGIGVFLAMVSFILVMPALISLADRWRLLSFRPEPRPTTHDPGVAADRVPFALPRVVLVASALLLVGGIVGATRITFEYNTRKLRPAYHQDEVERRSGNTYGRSFTPTLLVADRRDQLLAANAAIRQIRSDRAARKQRAVINRVLSILDFVPPRQHEKRAILEELAELLQDKRWNLVSDAARERIKLEELRRMAKAKPFRLEDLPVEVRRGFRGPGFGEVWLTMVWHRVDLSDLRQAAQLKEVVGRFDGASFVNLRNVVPKDVDLLVDVDGERAELRCPGGRKGCVEAVIASLKQLRLKGKPVFRHVLPVREAVRKKIAVAGGLRGQVLAVAQPWVVLRATRGPRAVQPSGVFNVSSGEIVLAEVVELLLSEGRVAFAVAFAAIFIAALLDFRSLRLTLLAVLPLVVGFLWTFGVSAFIGLKLNLFNFVILPALFGIGIDYGVHYVHRYTSEGPGSLGRVMRSLYWVIFFCACTSIIGFGNMALAAHPGLRSLGQLSIVGLACIFFASTYTLPAVLYVVEVLRGKQPVPAPDTGEIVVYAVSYCPVCRLVRRLLTDSGVRYTYVELDTLPAEQRQEIAARLGELASAEIPVTRVGERFVSGFAPEELRQAIATLDHDTGDR